MKIKKIFTAMVAVAFGFTTFSTAFAGELDTLQTIEKSGGNIQVGTMVAINIGSDALNSTSNLMTSEVNGVTPEIDTTNYEVVSKYLKMSLQDVIGNEISFNTGVTLSFNGIDSNIKDPTIIFNDGTTNIELDGVYDPNVSILTVKGVQDVNGVFVVVSKLVDSIEVTPVTNNIVEENVETNSGVVANNINEGKGIENIQDRKTGASLYLLMLVAGIILTSGGVVLYRKIG